MTQHEFSLTNNPIASLVRDVRRAIRNKQVEFDKAVAYIRGDVNIRVGGVFDSFVQRHDLVSEAIQSGDPQKEHWARELVKVCGDRDLLRGYTPMMASLDHNLIPDKGIEFLENLLFGNAAKITTWYHGPFVSNWTPGASAGSDWGKTSGGLATELSDAQITASARQPAVFAVAAASKKISSSTPTTITLETGAANISLFGSTLNEVSTIGYTGTDKVLIAATRFTSTKTGLGASDVISISYEITGSST